MSSYVSIRVLGLGPIMLTFTVIAEAHLCLAEANGVLALADAIKLFEFFLVNALQAVSVTNFQPFVSRKFCRTWEGK